MADQLISLNLNHNFNQKLTFTIETYHVVPNIKQIYIGIDFVPTGLVSDKQGKYIKLKEGKDKPHKLLVYKVKGTKKYCTIYKDTYLLLENYDAYHAQYKSFNGKFYVDANEKSVQKYDESIFKVNDSEAKPIWFRFAKCSNNHSYKITPSPGSENDLFLEGESIEIINNPKLQNSSFNIYFQSKTNQDFVFPIKKVSESHEEYIIPATDGIFILNKRRVDYVRASEDGMFYSVKDVPHNKLEELGLKYINIESVGLPGITPIYHYKNSGAKTRFTIHNLILGFGVLLFAIMPVLLQFIIHMS